MIEGRGPSPKIVNILARGLPDTCLTMALIAGGREHYGWGQDRHISVDLYDAINQNTRATGQWKGKAPDIAAYPRPSSIKAKPEERKKPKTVADLYRGFQK